MRGQRLDERGAALPRVTEQHVFLRGEVAEEGAGRDLARGGDLLDGGAVEALAGEELHGGVVQRLTGPGLLPLTEADDELARVAGLRTSVF